jgi:hypothetical protein
MEKLSTDGMVFHAVLTPDGKTMVYRTGNGRKTKVYGCGSRTSNNIQIITAHGKLLRRTCCFARRRYGLFHTGERGRPRKSARTFTRCRWSAAFRKSLRSKRKAGSAFHRRRKISYVRCPYKDDEFLLSLDSRMPLMARTSVS